MPDDEVVRITRPYDCWRNTGQAARNQHRNPADQIEKTVGRPAQVFRRGVGDHGGEKALGHAQVQAPQADAGPQPGAAIAKRQGGVGGDEQDETEGEQAGVADAVGELAERIGDERINDVHPDQHQGRERDGQAPFGRAQHQEGFGKSRQREDRADAHHPPIRAG